MMNSGAADFTLTIAFRLCKIRRKIRRDNPEIGAAHPMFTLNSSKSCRSGQCPARLQRTGGCSLQHRARLHESTACRGVLMRWPRCPFGLKFDFCAKHGKEFRKPRRMRGPGRRGNEIPVCNGLVHGNIHKRVPPACVTSGETAG